MTTAERERKLNRIMELHLENRCADIGKSTFTRISARMLLETLKHDNVVLLTKEVKRWCMARK
jgi:hypothetical protein